MLKEIKMSKTLGERIVAMVIDKNEEETFVQKDGVTYRVASEDASDLQLGETIEGFSYIDKENRHSFTTKIPDVRKGNFGWGEVVDVRRDLGVFVDVNWTNKDLVVSLDDLPEMMQLWPKIGDKLFLTVEVDEKDRMWGKLADEEEFFDRFEPGTEELHNKDMAGVVFKGRKSGTYIYTDEKYIAFVHPSERDREPRLGEYVNGRVIGLREDGVVYFSLLPRAYEIMDEDAAMLLEVLKRAPENKIPFHDKSDAEEIRRHFGISKGQFKRAVGRLMKQRLVNQDQTGTKLVVAPEEIE
jgi:hypothetical protein